MEGVHVLRDAARGRRAIGARARHLGALCLLITALWSVTATHAGPADAGGPSVRRMLAPADEAGADGFVDLGPGVSLRTQRRGLTAAPSVDGGTKYVMVQCHRGQFSNRLMCIRQAVILARALQRVLVLPIFTDVAPIVDVANYVSLDCFRRNYQAVTYAEFQEELCRDAGQSVTAHRSAAERDHAAPPSSSPSASHASAADDGRDDASLDARGAEEGLGEEGVTGAFCADGALLQLSTGYSLEDYSGHTCWSRREDISNARDLGIQVGSCTHVPLNGTLTSYTLEYVMSEFANRPEKVLLFLDLFGVSLFTSRDDMALTVSQPGQMCGWMPTESAAAAADAVMQQLIPPLLPRGALEDGAAAPAAAGGTAHGSSGHRHLAGGGGGGGAGSTGGPPALRLRGERSYMAVHLRRSDWFYYCGGLRRCFYSMTHVAAWLNATLADSGADTLYVSTNADARERDMLRRGVSGRLLFWEDVVSQLRRWQAALAADAGDGGSGGGGGGEGPAPSWIARVSLGDPLMVQMVEKAICMQAARFVSSAGSTFSEQIRTFRDGGLEAFERQVLVAKFGAAAVGSALPSPPDGAARVAGSSDGGATAAAAVAAAAPAAGESEPPLFLCDDAPPQDGDSRRYPDVHNPNIFFEQAHRALASLRARAAAVLGLAPADDEDASAAAATSAPPDGGASAAAAAAAAQLNGDDVVGGSPPPAPHRLPPRRPRASALAVAWRWLQRVVLVAADGHAMAAANRFVEMYTGGAVVSLVLEGPHATPSPAALADCVADAVARSGAAALHVSMARVPPEQQVLVMQALEARPQLRQITRIVGPDQERGNTFTLLWRGDGLGRRAEPARLAELPVFLEQVDGYVAAKGRVLLGDARSGLFRTAAATRRLFDFDDVRDGACGPRELAAAEAEAA